MFQRKLFTAFALATCLVPRFAAAGDLDLVRFVPVDASIELRASGEVWVRSSGTLQVHDNLYSVSFAFASQEHLDRALATGFDAVRLNELDGLEFLDRGGKLIRKEAEGVSLLDISQSVGGTLCGDVVVRGFRKLEDGLWVGVSVHSLQRRRELVDIDLDAGEDCDFWALGGCGGPKCANIYHYDTHSDISVADCKELDEDPWWFPNTCRCI